MWVFRESEAERMMTHPTTTQGKEGGGGVGGGEGWRGLVMELTGRDGWIWRRSHCWLWSISGGSVEISMLQRSICKSRSTYFKV
jgi:hypothetical protein